MKMKKRIVSLLLAAALVLGLCPAVFADNFQLEVSDGCLEYIKAGEGFSSMPYNDGTGWYIGYGCACDPADYPNGITQAQAEELLREKMALFGQAVIAFLDKHDIGASQGQFDALCSMSYNLGTAWLNEQNRLPAMLIKGVENYSDEEIVSAFAAWCHIGSTVSEGLLTRRIIEAKMFLYEDYGCTGEGWKWLVADAGEGQAEYKIWCYKSGGSYGSLPRASREGYTLAGWETTDGRVLSAEDTVSENLYVKALWSQVDAVSPEFPDVKTTAWYYPYVARLVADGVINGHTDGTFKPDQDVSWGQALKLVLLSAGFSQREPEEDGHWASGYLSLAEARGYVKKGYVSDLDKSISRNEIADLAAAALELSVPEGMENPFADTDRKSVLALYAEGILEGSIEGGKRLYKGENNIRRSEICAVLCRMEDYVDRTWVIFAGYRVPINYDLPANSYDNSLFRSDGERIYYDDPELDVRCGIDVSEHQGVIDWAKVAADGVDFAIIRVGYRGYSKGTLNTDKYFLENLQGAINAGLDVGVYFFSQAISAAEAVEEAEYVLSLIRGYELSYPVVFDWEPLPYTGSRTRSYDGGIVTDCAIAFSQRVAQEGYTPMVYYNKTMAYLKLDLTRLQDYQVWFAQYSTPYPTYIYHYDMWQYGSSGSVEGISGNVDMNISFKDYSK